AGFGGAGSGRDVPDEYAGGVVVVHARGDAETHLDRRHRGRRRLRLVAVGVGHARAAAAAGGDEGEALTIVGEIENDVGDEVDHLGRAIDVDERCDIRRRVIL